MCIRDSNAQAYRLIESWPGWNAPSAIIHGPPGSGKTHLAHIWAAASGARIMEAAQLSASQVAHLAGRPLVIENADAGAIDEDAAFHLLNLAREHNFSVLLTARDAPGHWTIALPDLRSRVRSYPAVAIAAPDDELLAAVVLKLFGDRQITLAPDAVPFLLQRMERSVEAAQVMVEEIDAASLAAQRKVTKAFIAAHLRARVQSEVEN
jgi:chromosomal replication initiation ATPase DnaA